MSRLSLKWLPAVVVPTVVVAAVIAWPLQAGAAVDLPDKTPEQVLLLVNSSTVSSFSGDVTQSANLGLPDLSGLSSMTGAMAPSGSEANELKSSEFADSALITAMEFLSGSHDFRVFVDGDSQSRVQVQDRMAERNIVRNGDDVWLYDSASNEATHVVIPQNREIPTELGQTAESKMAELKEKFAADPVTPAELAERVLAELDPSTSISVGKDARVAGRSVYQLVLTPKAQDSLIASVSIAVDSETGMPLDVAVMAVGQSAPAMQVGFTAIDFSAPDTDLFSFVPPASAKVTEPAFPTDDEIALLMDKVDEGAAQDAAATDSHPVVTGTGWSSIVSIPASMTAGSLGDNAMLDQFTQAVDGGRALTSSLLTVLFTDDGRILAGAVPLATLQAAAE